MTTKQCAVLGRFHLIKYQLRIRNKTQTQRQVVKGN